MSEMDLDEARRRARKVVMMLRVKGPNLYADAVEALIREIDLIHTPEHSSRRSTEVAERIKNPSPRRE